ncbi:unnamed protein product, partial [Ectocarpus fasciculatus]
TPSLHPTARDQSRGVIHNTLNSPPIETKKQKNASLSSKPFLLCVHGRLNDLAKAIFFLRSSGVPSGAAPLETRNHTSLHVLYTVGEGSSVDEGPLHVETTRPLHVETTTTATGSTTITTQHKPIYNLFRASVA